ncbi:putative kinesin light chain [Talaromyces proteolyticus]|uniref:Kinesin light chain n=1 Tax=Talaromyces proteolyticus TaxID=1131652 RepID=A0AAD4PSI5_9EURO|nr:putative kinesin light chain [Talaromyces proteolyticus]KAH8691416.1 putative kinesin light chain [Talaromyces proteolyticus]
MDGLSGAASVIAVVSLAIQIASGLNTLKSFWGSMKSAHSDVKSIIEDIQLLLDIIELIRSNSEKYGSDGTTESALRSCQDRIEVLNKLAQDIELGCRSTNKRKRLWTPFKAALKLKDIQKFQDTLHDTKLTLVLARQTSSFAITQHSLNAIQTGVQGLGLKRTVKQYISTIPFERDLKFVPRVTAMTRLQMLITNQKKAGLAGMGGVGKSQLAIELCYDLKERDPAQHIIWIYASTAARIEQAYMSIAKNMQLPGWDDPACDTMKLVCEWLNDESNGKWLLVLDSADDLDVFFATTPRSQTVGKQGNLARYIPNGSHGSLVVTSRDRRVCQRMLGNDSVIEIGPMTESESTQFLASILPSPQNSLTDEIHALATTLDNIPLAMSQAAAFISENRLEITEYHQLLIPDEFGPLDVLDEDLSERRRDSTAHSSIFQTWKISFDFISNSQPRASKLLALMAMLDRQDIPKLLLQDDDEKPLVFHKALGTLQAFALVAQQQRTQSFSMHRLVQLATLRWLHTKGEQRHYKTTALTRLAQRFPKGLYETQEYCAALASHARLVLSYEDVADSNKLDSAMLLQNLASFEIMQGRLYEARNYQKRCISIRETLLGISHISTLECMRDLACNLRDIAEFKEAENLHRRSLLILESSGPAYNSALLATKSDLADLLWSLGKYEEAETLSREAVAGRADLLGTNHADTITSMGVLSLILCALAKKGEGIGNSETHELSHTHKARYSESASLARDVFEKRKEILGPNHPQTLVSMNNLSWVLRNKGDFVESELLAREALERKEKELGKDHHDTLNCKYCLAVVLGCQGRHEEAEQIYREHLEAVVRVLGKGHPNTMRSMRGLGKALESQGKVNQALEIYREAYNGLLGTLGPDHISTMESKALFERLSDYTAQDNKYISVPISSNT